MARVLLRSSGETEGERKRARAPIFKGPGSDAGDRAFLIFCVRRGSSASPAFLPWRRTGPLPLVSSGPGPGGSSPSRATVARPIRRRRPPRHPVHDPGSRESGEGIMREVGRGVDKVGAKNLRSSSLLFWRDCDFNILAERFSEAKCRNRKRGKISRHVFTHHKLSCSHFVRRTTRSELSLSTNRFC